MALVGIYDRNLTLEGQENGNVQMNAKCASAGDDQRAKNRERNKTFVLVLELTLITSMQTKISPVGSFSPSTPCIDAIPNKHL
jgi:hypothetical protein